MKKALARTALLLLAAAVGLIYAPRVQGQFGGMDPSSFGSQLQAQLDAFSAGLDEMTRAALAAGSFSNTVKSISVNTTGGYTCEGGVVKQATGRGFLVTAANNRKAIFTAAGEDSLKRTLAAAMAAQLAGLNVSFIGTPTDCSNVTSAAELTITK